MLLINIGMKYKLLGFNKIVKYNEYFTDGITKNQEEYKKKNIDGYLLKYVWNITNLFQYDEIGLLAKFRISYQYFYGMTLKGSENIENIKLSFPYSFIKYCLPLMNFIKNNIRKKG